MAATNDVTGDSISTKPTSDSYRDGYDKIFAKPEQPASSEEQPEPEKPVEDVS